MNVCAFGMGCVPRTYYLHGQAFTDLYRVACIVIRISLIHLITDAHRNWRQSVTLLVSLFYLLLIYTQVCTLRLTKHNNSYFILLGHVILTYMYARQAPGQCPSAPG